MDIFYYIASPAAILISAGVGILVGRSGQRRSELERRLKELEDFVWRFAQIAEEYWNLESRDDKLRGLEISMKNLSLRIGSNIAQLNSNYSDYLFDNSSLLFALRQAATGPPFEENGRQANPQRGDEIRRAASELVHEIPMARKNFRKRLIGNRFFQFLIRMKDIT